VTPPSLPGSETPTTPTSGSTPVATGNTPAPAAAPFLGPVAFGTGTFIAPANDVGRNLVNQGNTTVNVTPVATTPLVLPLGIGRTDNGAALAGPAPTSETPDRPAAPTGSDIGAPPVNKVPPLTGKDGGNDAPPKPVPDDDTDITDDVPADVRADLVALALAGAEPLLDFQPLMSEPPAAAEMSEPAGASLAPTGNLPFWALLLLTGSAVAAGRLLVRKEREDEAEKALLRWQRSLSV
jgi:hypothetical protein